MKKLKLRALDFDGAELLTKEQLKKILGGGMMGTGGDTDTATETSTVCYTKSCYCKDSDGNSTGSSNVDFCGQPSQINLQVQALISGCTYGGGCS